MHTTKLIHNGQYQAVRLPKEYQFSGDDFMIDTRNLGKLQVREAF
jgi:virulence-associated protein VagC